MNYSLSQAAAACGLDKSTIRRAVKSGRISGNRDAFGQWRVDAAELHRVYPPAERTDGEPVGALRDAPAESAHTDALVAELRAVIADLRQGRDAAIEDLRRDRDAWRAQAERLALPKPAVRTWWRWLRTTA